MFQLITNSLGVKSTRTFDTMHERTTACRNLEASATAQGLPYLEHGNDSDAVVRVHIGR